MTLVWLGIHLTCSILADIFAVAAGAMALFYLWQDRLLKNKQLSGSFRYLPPIHKLDNLGLKFQAFAFVLMSIGICAGIWLATQSWGKSWYLDPRQWWSFLTWGVFAIVLFLRLLVGFRGRRAATITLLGTFLVLSGALLLNWFEWSKHKGVINL